MWGLHCLTYGRGSVRDERAQGSPGGGGGERGGTRSADMRKELLRSRQIWLETCKYSNQSSSEPDWENWVHSCALPKASLRTTKIVPTMGAEEATARARSPSVIHRLALPVAVKNTYPRCRRARKQGKSQSCKCY